MEQPTFDRYAKSYDSLHRKSIAASGYAPEYFDEYKVREMARQWYKIKGTRPPRRILNFGCGIGKSEIYLRAYFGEAEIFSCDISALSLQDAKLRNKQDSRINFGQIVQGKLPFAPGAEMVLAANVFHHIPPSERAANLRTIREAMDRDGLFFIFEHNPRNPLTLRAVRDCPFDQDAILLPAGETHNRLQQAGFTQIKISYRLFFPHALRRLVPLEPWLGKVPLGAQYFAMAVKP